MPTVDDVIAMGPVIAVLALDDPARAQPIAGALVRGGVRALEVTMRSPAALEVMAEMAKVDGALVGAGTVIGERHLDRAIAAGAAFIVSPGLTDRLGAAAIERGVPFLPGVSDASDLMRGLDLGLTRFKFFPAEASGGIAALKALSAPFYQCRFCPTGGITQDSAAAWLAMPSVGCVGGSWLVPAGEPDLGEIEHRARAASALR